MAKMMASDMETKERVKAFSVSVRVSASEFLNSRSMACTTTGELFGWSTPIM